MQNNYKEKILVKKLWKGDVLAFDMLFETYAKKLFAFSVSYLKSESDAEELVQEVFAKVWEKRKSLRMDTSFKAYLFTIAYNDILKYFRSNRYHQAYIRETIALTDIHDRSEERIYYSSVLERVDELIEKLPERRKAIFIKSRKEGLNSKEIAGLLGIAPGTVDNNISEALKFLRTNFKKEGMAIM